MLFTSREVRIGKNCARGLEYGPCSKIHCSNRPAVSKPRCPFVLASKLWNASFSQISVDTGRTTQ